MSKVVNQIYTLVFNPETKEVNYISSMDVELALNLTQQIVIANAVEKSKTVNNEPAKETTV